VDTEVVVDTKLLEVEDADEEDPNDDTDELAELTDDVVMPPAELVVPLVVVLLDPEESARYAAPARAMTMITITTTIAAVLAIPLTVRRCKLFLKCIKLQKWERR